MPNFEVFRKNLLFPTIFECKHRVCSEKSYISTHQKAANYKFFFGVLSFVWTLYSDLGKTCNRIIVPGRCESTCFRIDCIMIILERILVLK